MTASQPVTLSVAMLTFQRPAELARAIPAVLEQVRLLATDGRYSVELLIVDNDPEESARAAVRDADAAEIRYVAEAEPGISAGRNRALDAAAASDLLVFIDDDEVPRPAWLSSLVTTWEATRPAAVRGNVVSVFDVEPDLWVTAGEFFARPPLVTGELLSVTATNNLLLDLHQVKAFGVRFDSRLGLSGGEDNLFTHQLTARGGRIVACAESVVTEFVPAERCTRSWVLARARRGGNTSSAIAFILADTPVQQLITRSRILFGGVVRAVGGVGRYLVGNLRGSDRDQARGMRAANRGWGMVTAALGHRVQEYARAD